MKKLTLALILICCSCNQNDSYFAAIAANDIKLNAPMDGEWLATHREKGQSFEAFLKSKPSIPIATSNTIYLRPIGNFNAIQQKQIGLTREYLEIYFQTKTKTLEAIPDQIVPKTARRVGYENNQQLLAGFILDSILKKEKHPNAIAFMGIAEADLYPKPEWNYVFGLASYKDRVGVSSIYRLQDTTLTGVSFNLCLERLLKISSHEIGHMFGLRHCIAANCTMNGTNNIEETDRNFARLCSNCQRKLQAELKYDNLKRLTELQGFFKRNRLNKEAQLLEKDANSL